MKTPEEIKKALEHCIKNAPCGECPMWPECQEATPEAPGFEPLLKYALAYIQQLEAKVHRWISVEERLPKEFETVIIWRSDCHQACIGWLIGGHWSVPKGVQVTHWMRMPEAPEEDDHAAD